MYTDPHYADSAFAIIGRAMESIVGKRYEDYVMERIFAPLGMDSSFFKYDSSSPAAKRIPPGLMRGSPIQVPSFAAHCNLYWGSPTGQVLLLSTPESKVILVS